MTSYGSYVLETFVTLVAVSALAFVLLYGARRLGVGKPTGGLALLGRLPLDSRRSVVLVKVAEQVFVVGVSEAGLTKLGELPAKDLPPMPEVGKVSTQPFASVLRGALGEAKLSKDENEEPTP